MAKGFNVHDFLSPRGTVHVSAYCLVWYPGVHPGTAVPRTEHGVHSWVYTAVLNSVLEYSY